MRIRGALVGFFLLTAAYVAALVWVDARRRVFDGLNSLAGVLPLLLAVSLGSYLARYLRWWWLLRRAGHAVPIVAGFFAYLAGFAFTATPGKVGELIRVRYFHDHGVPAWRVVAVFVFERAMDLLVVLGLAMLAIRDPRVLAASTAFVLLCLTLVVVLGWRPGWLSCGADLLRRGAWPTPARWIEVLRDGLAGGRLWVRPLDLGVSLALGLLAWGTVALGFRHLIGALGVNSVPTAEALSIYPLSMLAGAASMLPGGIGSTEATITALLSLSHVDLSVGVLAAVGIRLSTLWFAILCGLVSVVGLEYRAARGADHSLSADPERPA